MDNGITSLYDVSSIDITFRGKDKNGDYSMTAKVSEEEFLIEYMVEQIPGVSGGYVLDLSGLEAKKALEDLSEVIATELWSLIKRKQVRKQGGKDEKDA